MRTSIVILACVLASVAQASPQTTLVRDVVNDPKPLVGREIRLMSLRCASEPGGKYACGTARRGKRLRVESLSLDYKTSAETRGILSSRCQGDLDRVSASCRFDVQLKVTGVRLDPPNASANAGAVNLSARRMDLFVASGR